MCRKCTFCTVPSDTEFKTVTFCLNAPAGPDGETPAEEQVCDDLNGALYGLCVAYCEAMDCHLGDQFASDRACERVLTNYMTHSDGEMPPCHDPVEGSEDEGSGDTEETDEGGQEGAPQA